jgi:hypothetical protein
VGAGAILHFHSAFSAACHSLCRFLTRQWFSILYTGMAVRLNGSVALGLSLGGTRVAAFLAGGWLPVALRGTRSHGRLSHLDASHLVYFISTTAVVVAVIHTNIVLSGV